jgi:hypothetical protein
MCLLNKVMVTSIDGMLLWYKDIVSDNNKMKQVIPGA